MHPFRPAVHLQLGEDDRQFGMPGGIADVVLARGVAVRGDHELLARGVVRRHGAERLDVGAVPGLGHREAAHQLPGDQIRQVGPVVPLGAEVQDRAAEEAELHAHLHQERQVSVGECLERGDRGADVTAPAVLLRKPHPCLAGGRQFDRELAHPLTERVDAELLGLFENGGVRRQIRTDQITDLGVLTVKQRGQGLYVDVGGLGGIVDHGPLVPREDELQAVHRRHTGASHGVSRVQTMAVGRLGNVRRDW